MPFALLLAYFATVHSIQPVRKALRYSLQNYVWFLSISIISYIFAHCKYFPSVFSEYFIRITQLYKKAW